VWRTHIYDIHFTYELLYMYMINYNIYNMRVYIYILYNTRVETFTHTHTHVFRVMRERVEHKTGLNLQYPSSVGKYLSTATHMAALFATPPPT